jgi:hypothetical protein
VLTRALSVGAEDSTINAYANVTGGIWAHHRCQNWDEVLNQVLAHALCLGAEGMYPVRCIAQNATF